MIRHAGVTAAAVVVVVLGGCSSGTDIVRGQSAQAAPVTTTAAPSTTTPPATTTTTAAPTTTASASPTQNAALAAALYKLSADSRALKSDPALAAVRSGVAGGLATSRKGVQVTRTAAYQTSVRNCANVAQGLATTRAGALAVYRAVGPLATAGATRQRQISSLNVSIANVRRLAAGHGATGTLPTMAEINAALIAATAQSRAETASLASTRAVGADGLARARGMVAAAAQIYAKTC